MLMIPPLDFREFRGWGDNPESRPSIPLGLWTFKGWLVTWDTTELSAVSKSSNSLSLFKEFTLSFKSWIWAKRWFTEEGFSLLQRELASSWKKNFVNPLLLGNLVHNLLEKLWLDQTNVLPERAPFLWIEDVCQFHQEQYQHFFSPDLLSNSACPSGNLVWPANSPCEALVQLPFGGIHEGFSVQTKFSPFSIWESCSLSSSRCRLSLESDIATLENWLNTSHKFHCAPLVCVLPGTYHVWKCLLLLAAACCWEPETTNGLAHSSRSCVNSVKSTGPLLKFLPSHMQQPC